jgi:hypothetical protein
MRTIANMVNPGVSSMKTDATCEPQAMRHRSLSELATKIMGLFLSGQLFLTGY